MYRVALLLSGATNARDFSTVVCRGKQRCLKSGGEHRYEECDNIQDECNCGGQHGVPYGGCEVRRKAIYVNRTSQSC